MKTRHYSFTTKNPMPNIGNSRKGIVAETSQGRWVDFSPLPGFSQESLPPRPEDFEEYLQTPSAQWGLMQAGLPASDEVSVLCNGLLGLRSGKPQTAIQELDRALSTLADQNYTHVKLKIPKTALDAILWGNVDFGDFRIRIDANQTYRDLNRDLEALASFGLQNLEYLEEPFRVHDISDLDTVVRAMDDADLPLALDESLAHLEVEALANYLDVNGPRVLTTLVLKPTLLGQKMPLLLELATRFGLSVVFSSCFESPVGYFHLANLAQRISPNGVHGLSLPDWDIPEFPPTQGPELKMKWSMVNKWTQGLGG